MKNKKMISRVRFQKKFLGIIETGYEQISVYNDRVQLKEEDGLFNKVRSDSTIQFPQLCGIYSSEGKIKTPHFLLGLVIIILGVFNAVEMTPEALLLSGGVSICGILVILYALARETEIAFITAGLTLYASGYISYSQLLSLIEITQKSQESYLHNLELKQGYDDIPAEEETEAKISSFSSN